MFQGPLQESILRRAQDKGLVDIRVHDLRAWTHDRHHVVDDMPYGGGAGMVLKPEPVFAAVEALRTPETTTVILSPQGYPFTQPRAAELAGLPHVLLVCGRYEGFDDRIPRGLRALELSIGDYVLTGGELPALVVLDAVIRLVPGVLGDETSAATDSFAGDLLEYPQYTRPALFRDMPVPPVLLSGDHGAVARWRRKESIRRTRERRPDLLARAELSEADRTLLAEIEAERDAGEWEIGRSGDRAKCG